MQEFPKFSFSEEPKTQKSPPIKDDWRGLLKTAATYSPTVTQYHRRDEA